MKASSLPPRAVCKVGAHLQVDRGSPAARGRQCRRWRVVAFLWPVLCVQSSVKNVRHPTIPHNISTATTAPSLIPIRSLLLTRWSLFSSCYDECRTIYPTDRRILESKTYMSPSPLLRRLPRVLFTIWVSLPSLARMLQGFHGGSAQEGRHPHQHRACRARARVHVWRRLRTRGRLLSLRPPAAPLMSPRG